MTVLNLPAHLEEITRTRAAASPSAQGLWRQAMEALHSLGLDPESEHTLAQAAGESRHLYCLARFLGERTRRAGDSPATRMEALFKAADASRSTLSEWVAALGVFYAWIHAQGRHTTFRKALGYLECCDASIGGESRLTNLAATTETMLETYGFDG